MQSRTWKYLIAGAGLVATAACADDQPANGPTMPPSRVSAAFGATGCDLTLTKQHARSYFVSNQDPVYDMLQTFATLNKNGPAAAFKQQGFAILAYVGSVAGTTAVTTPTVGDPFVRDVLTCLGFTTTAGQFTAALGPNGLFGVPSGKAAVVSRGTPSYGAEPKGTNDWPTSLGQQVLLYGFPRDYGFSTENPAAATAYELATIPSGLVFAKFIRVGVCQVTGSTPRIQHKGGNQAIILAPELPVFCGNPAPQTARANGQDSGFLAFARRLSDWIAPRRLYATAVVGGMGGSLGGLSPIGAVNVDVTAATLTFTQQPSNGTINSPITPAIAVKATAAGGTPVDGLTITLTVVGNSGSFNILPGSNIAITANGGIATFPNFQVDKAGGYTLTATGSFDGGVTKTPGKVSNQFQVNGQGPQ